MAAWEAWRQQQSLWHSDPEALKSYQAQLERQQAVDEVIKSATMKSTAS